MRRVCYGIVGKTGLWMSEACVCEDADALKEELEYAREEKPNEDYRIMPLFTLRRTTTDSSNDAENPKSEGGKP